MEFLIFLAFFLVLYFFIKDEINVNHKGDVKRNPDVFHDIDTYVAGIPHQVGMVWCKNNLKIGEYLQAVRESKNLHDSNAICLYWNGKKIGYIPKVANIMPAKHMDAKGNISVKVISVDCSDKWKGVKIKIVYY